MSFENNSVRKNLFLIACFCWDSRVSLREMDQNFNLVEVLVTATRFLEFLFRHFKVFGLHSMLHDATGEVRAHSGKHAGYCYMIGRQPISSSLGNVTGLLFCFYIKLSPPSISKSVDFWISMSCIVQDIELADERQSKSLGFLLMTIFRDAHFIFQKRTNPQNKHFCVQETSTELYEPVDVWLQWASQHSSHRCKRWTFCKRNRKSRFLPVHWIKRWKTWMSMAVPKIKMSLMKKRGFARVTQSDRRL